MTHQPDPDTNAENEKEHLAEKRDRYQRTIQELYQVARAACDEIIRFSPELVIVLAHGGWAALWATQALWEATRGLVKMLTSRNDNDFAYSNSDVKAYLLAKLSQHEIHIWVGFGPALPEDDLIQFQILLYHSSSTK